MAETKQITEEQAKNIVVRIETYLKTRLGKGNSFRLTIKDIKSNHITAESDVLSPSDLGRFSVVVKEYFIRICVFVDLEHGRFGTIMHYYFELANGGSNGMQMPFQLTGNVFDTYMSEIP